MQQSNTRHGSRRPADQPNVATARAVSKASLRWTSRVHINDLHATMLYLLGLDHEKLTYRYSGQDYRLTDLAGVVAKDVVA